MGKGLLSKYGAQKLRFDIRYLFDYIHSKKFTETKNAKNQESIYCPDPDSGSGIPGILTEFFHIN